MRHKPLRDQSANVEKIQFSIDKQIVFRTIVPIDCYLEMEFYIKLTNTAKYKAVTVTLVTLGPIVYLVKIC